MKILYIADQYSTGGAADALIEIITALEGKIKPIVLTSYNGALEERLRERNIEYYRAGHWEYAYPLPTYNLKRMIFVIFTPIIKIVYRILNKLALIRAERWIDLTKIDIIHSNVNRNDIGAVLASKYSIPHIWHLREHTTGHFELKFNRKNPYQYMNKYTTKFIAISKSVMKNWVEQGLECSKMELIYDGDKLSLFIPHKKNCHVDKKLKIVFVGSIYEAKGQLDLLEAVAQLSMDLKHNIRIDFYGNGSLSYIKKLKRFCDVNNLSRVVRFLGYSSNLYNILQNYDIGVNSSRREGFGRTNIEYMASGLCVIAKLAGANPEIINNTKTGFLYKDTSELAQLIKELFYNQDILKSVALEGQKYALNKFNLESNVEKIYNLYLQYINLDN